MSERIGREKVGKRALLPASVVRPRGGPHENRVTYVELFFDLVFVFTIIQLSHTLGAHYGLVGGLETTLLILAVWWVWVYTAWVTNWLDPEAMPVRLAIFGLMFGALLLSAAIPTAFLGGGLLFAMVYVAMQLGRSLFAMLALRGHWPENHRNFVRISIWMGFSAIFWIAGGFAQHEARITLWIIAVAIEYASPALGFRVPFLGHSRVEDWDVAGGHFSERCALFVLICLGETILAAGRTISDMPIGLEGVALSAATLATTAALWWIYFRYGHSRGSREMEKTAEPGAVARFAYTYGHIPIVGGIILTAVATEKMLEKPFEHVDMGEAIAVIGGPALFLAGTLWFKAAVTGRVSISHLLGLVLLALLFVAPFLGATMVLLHLLVLCMLLAVAIWEMRALGNLPEH